jgi:cell division protein FtsX
MAHIDGDISLILRRGTRRGVVTLLRERGWGTTLSTLLGVTLLLQLLLLIGLGIQGIDHLLRAQTDLRLEIQEGATDDGVQEFFAAVKQLPYVEDARYITKEQAYEMERRRDPELVQFLEEFKLRNPFPDTISVTLKSLNDYEQFASFSRGEQWADVVNPAFLSQVTDQESQVYELLHLTNASRSLVLFFFALVSGVLLFVLMELVRRRSLARSEEIVVERLVGAHDLAVLLPFATEAAILLALSVVLSSVLLVLFLFVLPIIVPALSVEGVFSALRAEMAPLLLAFLPLFFLLELLLVPAVSFAGAWFGMRPWMKSPRLSLVTY